MPTIKVKLITRGKNSFSWKRQISGSSEYVGDCHFIFDRSDDCYDWLVVIDDVSRRYFSKPEVLACANKHTLLVTTEPPTITSYGQAFVSQFEYVLTSQPEEYLSHRNRTYSQTGNFGSMAGLLTK